MKTKIIFLILQIFCGLSVFAQNDLSSKKFSYQKITGIGYEEGVTRRDPSDVIKVGDTYYVYYTKLYEQAEGYWGGTVWYATSKDEGLSWTEQGRVINVGEKGTFDSKSVFTPNIIYAKGKYYLYYTGVKPTPGRTDGVFENNSTNDVTAIGVTVSDSPNGPFKRISKEPILTISTDDYAFDSFRIDDASLLFKNNKYWLYYKGRCLNDGKRGPGLTKMGVAMADRPEGPFVKYEKNPIMDRSHEVLIWPYKKGVYALASFTSMIQFAPDGLDFVSKPLNMKKENRPNAPGAYRPDLTKPGKAGQLKWGISMVHNRRDCYLIRYTLE